MHRPVRLPVAMARSRATIGAYGSHRLTDVGDDWRSLLLGAPPAGRSL